MKDQPESSEPRAWWETRWLMLALIVGSAVPLLYPPVPPLVDLLGHMGRYRVELDLPNSPWLKLYYDFRWAPIGNLGVDLLVLPLGKLIGLEPAVKLIVLAIPPLTVAGFLWVAREVHHRLPPTALFAVPFAYSHPFMFGFVNFALAMALAFLAFGLWLRLARFGRLRLRAILFVPISIVVYFTHTYGWGTLGLLCFSAEAVRQHDRGIGWFRAGVRAALHASVMALPVLIALAWRNELGGGLMTYGWFNLSLKFNWLISVLRDRWKWFDLAALAVCLVLIVEARRRRDLTFSRNLAFSSLVLLAAFVVIPWTVFSSAYADMRLIPYAIAVALLAIRLPEGVDPRSARWFAVAGLAFVVVRLAGTTASLAIAATDQQQKLALLDQVPEGSRVASLVGVPCGGWPLVRNTHLGGMVIVRRRGFSNDQWATEGQNLMRLRYHAGAFSADPSQIARPVDCKVKSIWSIEDALKALPRDRFDYLWLIEAPRFDRKLLDGAELVGRAAGSELYRLTPASAAPSPASTTAHAAAAPGE